MAALLAVVAGCGSPKTYPVEGKVVFKEDGKPLTGGSVVFESVTPPHGRAMGYLDSEGNYSLSTLEEGGGAVAGEHRVRVEPEIPEHLAGRMNPNQAMATVIDARFLDFQTSRLKYTIKPGKNHFVIEVEKPTSR